MIPNYKRKSIAKSFIYENFNGRKPELWKNYKVNDEKGLPKSWCPIPCPWVHDVRDTDAIIGVGETIEELQEIVFLELPESRWDMVEYEEYEYVDGKKYFVVFD